jgi:NAD(P)-dependent dehydrogenase (short-subunit alcohol dehydrogenase family)
MTTRVFAVRLAEAGIGVYEVRPGIIETDVTRPVKARCDREIADGLVPARRWGYPARPSWIHGRDSHAGENPPPTGQRRHTA